MAKNLKVVTQELELPSRRELLSEIEAIASESDAAFRCLKAAKSRTFIDPDGRADDLRDVVLSPEQLGLIAHLSKMCPTALSVEVGFGMGSSTTAILASRSLVGKQFEHIVFDPYGLGRGTIVEDYLKNEFRESYCRIWKRSQVGLGQLLDERGPETAGLIFIDGSHTFEAVMTDFVLSDALCAVGGHIIFDDALFPAIETVINYIKSNRSQYSLAHLKVNNTTVIRKLDSGELRWDQFKPFSVPHRQDWTPLDPTLTTVAGRLMGRLMARVRATTLPARVAARKLVARIGVI
jgi:hypothetical protein